MATLEQVVNALRAEMPGINVQGLREREDHRIMGIVIDQVFDDLDYPDRQPIIWNALKRHLPAMELALVGPIVGLSPAEAESKSSDAA